MGLGTRVLTVILVLCRKNDPGRKEHVLHEIKRFGTRVRSFFHYHKTITQLNNARRHTLEHGGSVIG